LELQKKVLFLAVNFLLCSGIGTVHCLKKNRNSIRQLPDSISNFLLQQNTLARLIFG